MRTSDENCTWGLKLQPEWLIGALLEYNSRRCSSGGGSGISCITLGRWVGWSLGGAPTPQKIFRFSSWKWLVSVHSWYIFEAQLRLGLLAKRRALLEWENVRACPTERKLSFIEELIRSSYLHFCTKFRMQCLSSFLYIYNCSSQSKRSHGPCTTASWSVLFMQELYDNTTKLIWLLWPTVAICYKASCSCARPG